MTVKNIKVATYRDGNEYITKFRFTNGVYLLNVVGVRKGPYGMNLVVEQNGVRFALPKLRAFSGIKDNGLYAVKIDGIAIKGKYHEIQGEVESITPSQFERMAKFFKQPNMLEGLGYQLRTRRVEDNSSSSSTDEFLTFRDIYNVFKEVNSDVKYYSEDHFCLVDGYKYRLQETKDGYRKSDVQEIVNKIVGE